MKKISIITINYNNASGLKKTMESVLKQTSPDFEYIVIDGGSNDGSVAVIDQHRDKLTVALSEKDSGIYNAQNKGIQYAKGEYLLFLNSGDYLVNNNILNDVSSALRGVDIVYGDIITIDKAGQTYKSLPDEMTARHFMLSTLWHPASFIRKELFDTYGAYNENYRISSDYEFFVKAVVKFKVSTRHIALPITVFDLNGVSNNPDRFQMMLAERKQIQKEFFSKSQLDEIERLEIAQEGQKSKAFKLVPNIKVFMKIYNKLYYHWYKWRVSS